MAWPPEGLTGVRSITRALWSKTFFSRPPRTDARPFPSRSCSAKEERRARSRAGARSAAREATEAGHAGRPQHVPQLHATRVEDGLRPPLRRLTTGLAGTEVPVVEREHAAVHGHRERDAEERLELESG